MQGECVGSSAIQSTTFARQIDAAHRCVHRFGMEAVVYDFAAVPFTPEGELITPSVIVSRNVPDEMHRLWCAGLYQKDPVQRHVLRSIRPIYWSYHAEERSGLSDAGEAGGPVAEYLCDHHLARGVTVSARSPFRGIATVTGIWRERPSEKLLGGSLMAEFVLMAHVLQEEILGEMKAEDMMTTAVRLTPREYECLRLCSEGHPDKQVAHLLDRSLSTVVMHMQSAMQKLGARNRAQAVARAAHYGFLN